MLNTIKYIKGVYINSVVSYMGADLENNSTITDIDRDGSTVDDLIKKALEGNDNELKINEWTIIKTQYDKELAELKNDNLSKRINFIKDSSIDIFAKKLNENHKK
jgi:5S rRNA maturation endonuclease (ribonuclease M5)